MCQKCLPQSQRWYVKSLSHFKRTGRIYSGNVPKWTNLSQKYEAGINFAKLKYTVVTLEPVYYSSRGRNVKSWGYLWILLGRTLNMVHWIKKIIH